MDSSGSTGANYLALAKYPPKRTPSRGNIRVSYTAGIDRKYQYLFDWQVFSDKTTFLKGPQRTCLTMCDVGPLLLICTEGVVSSV